MKARRFVTRPTSSSTQTINETARERMGEYKPLTFAEVLLVAIELQQQRSEFTIEDQLVSSTPASFISLH